MRRYSPADAHHGDFHHAKQLLGMVFFMVAHPYGRIKRRIYAPVFARRGGGMACAGIVRDGHMDAASVWANKTAHSFAGIRPWMPRRYSPMDATPVFARRGCICGIKRTTIVTTINAN